MFAYHDRKMVVCVCVRMIEYEWPCLEAHVISSPWFSSLFVYVSPNMIVIVNGIINGIVNGIVNWMNVL